jgi:hypothetical protein
MPETKLCDGILSEKLINPQFGSCGKGKPTVITKDLCADCLAVYQSRKS